MSILSGLSGLCQEMKGTAFLLTLAIAGAALFAGKLPGGAFAAVIATIFSVFTASHAYQVCQTPPDGPQGKL